MNPKQRDSLVTLFREYVNMMEETAYMALILDKAEILGSSVRDWRSEVKRLRLLPSRTEAQARILRGLIDSFERSHDENAVIRLIERMRQGKPN